MVNAHLDILELELRKLHGVRSVGFTSQHDVLYIQLFVESNAPTAGLPFEATRIAQRHSSSPVAVEIVRWAHAENSTSQNESLFSPEFTPIQNATEELKENEREEEIPLEAQDHFAINDDDSDNDSSENHNDFVSNELSLDAELGLEHNTNYDSQDIEDVNKSGSYEDDENIDNNTDQNEIDLVKAEQEELETIVADTTTANTDSTEDDTFPTFEDALESHDEVDGELSSSSQYEEITILTVTTSAGNNEIEVHLLHQDTRTIGRAPTDRGLLGAIDATMNAITQLLGENEFHAEWARSLEPNDEHASLVAVGLTNDEGTNTRHGLAGGNSPIEAAARATLNALSNSSIPQEQELNQA